MPFKKYQSLADILTQNKTLSKRPRGLRWTPRGSSAPDWFLACFSRAVAGPVTAGFAKQTCVFAILRISWNRMPRTKVALYREEDGSCPFIEWFDKLPAKVQDKCYLRLERLHELGHELRRPEAAFRETASTNCASAWEAFTTGSFTSFTE